MSETKLITNRCQSPHCECDEMARAACDARLSKTVEITNERGAGLKFDSGKPRWSLMMQGCALALLGVARVLTFGAKKYAAHSWRSVESGEERYRDALYRHLHEIERGEAIDLESGESHWSHVIANAMFLEELRITRNTK